MLTTITTSVYENTSERELILVVGLVLNGILYMPKTQLSINL